MAPGEDPGPNALDDIAKKVKSEYRAGDGVVRGSRNAVNVFNPIVQAFNETSAAYEANKAGDFAATGRHTFGAVAALVGLAELRGGALGGLGKGSGSSRGAVGVTDTGIEGEIPDAKSTSAAETTSQSRGGAGSGITGQTVKQLLDSQKSIAETVAEHQQKLADYIADPYSPENDHLGTLKNAPPEIKPKIIAGRIKVLQAQIVKNQGELAKVVAELARRQKLNP